MSTCGVYMAVCSHRDTYLFSPVYERSDSDATNLNEDNIALRPIVHVPEKALYSVRGRAHCLYARFSVNVLLTDGGMCLLQTLFRKDALA
jgi:hypothetical protein